MAEAQMGSAAMSKDPRAEYLSKYQALGMLRKFPPFSTDLDMTERYVDDLHAATRAVSDKINADLESDDPADEGSVEFAKMFEGAFESVEQKWADDLDIARLYSKRYGDDYLTAQEEALNMEGLTTDSPNVPHLG
jgi:hypothetical protein